MTRPALAAGHDGMHGDGDCTVWDRDYASPIPPGSGEQS